MLCASSPSSFAPLAPAPAAVATFPVALFVGFDDHKPIRYDHDHRRRCSWNGIEKKMNKSISMRWRTPFPRNRTASASFVNQLTKDTTRPINYHEIAKTAREKFTQEISFQSKDRDISLAKLRVQRWVLVCIECLTLSLHDLRESALLYIAAEDEAFLAFNREMDTLSLMNERKSVQVQSDSNEKDSEELTLLAGKSISGWLNELNTISKEVEAELVSRDIGCHLVQVLEAVNVVLFELRGFKRTSVVLDPKYLYLHSVLNCRRGSAFLLSVIYIEVCQRLGLPMVGSRVGEDFLIWPQLGYPEELFKVTSGQSLFAIVNGRCVEDPGSMASDLTGNSLLGLEIATNRDIIGIALANLIRLHWRRASRSNHGLMLTSPLRQLNNISSSNVPLLRPQDLRLAIMASERLLILQPHNWALRRDHGMMLYYNRQYGEAVQELSICMAFAPEEEADVLEPFVEKLHLLRLESSWKSLGHSGRLTVP